MIIYIAQLIVLLFGVTVIVLAAWGIFAPARLMTWVTSIMDHDWGIYIAVIVRLVLGAALVIAAPGSMFPTTFAVLGSITIVAAVALALLGRKRMRRFIAWFSERFSTPMLRFWLLFGIGFGGFLAYGAL